MKTLIAAALLLTSTYIWATDVSIKGADIDLNKGADAKLTIKHAGTINDNPSIQVSEKLLTLTVPNSGLAGKINKKVNGVNISATMTSEESVAIFVKLPYSLKGRESEVTMTLKEGLIDVHFPKNIEKKSIVNAENSRAPSVTDKAVLLETNTANNIEAEKLDENYLSSLVKKQEKLTETNHPEAKKEDTDRVTLTQSGVTKTSTQNSGSNNPKEVIAKDGESRFSVAGYIGKFVAFLSLMIAGFYGVLTLFKKGIIKKGKLGFLHSTKLVEVLSTTHIAPKRQLLMVKAHKQVFLISSSESGVQFLSEINDVTGLIKSGEEEITGSNFDTNLNSANKIDKQFKLKEVEEINSYAADYPMDSLDDMLNDEVPNRINSKTTTNASKAIEKNPVKDQVRFSDQIKTKVKNLKQL